MAFELIALHASPPAIRHDELDDEAPLPNSVDERPS